MTKSNLFGQTSLKSTEFARGMKNQGSRFPILMKNIEEMTETEVVTKSNRSEEGERGSGIS